eukprot:3934844-Amphidinium_carterae.1
MEPRSTTLHREAGRDCLHRRVLRGQTPPRGAAENTMSHRRKTVTGWMRQARGARLAISREVKLRQDQIAS